MNDWTAERLRDLGYDYLRSQIGSHTDVCGISKGHLKGAVLFSGTIIARDNISHSLQNNYLMVSNECNGKLVSLYIAPLEKTFREQGICLKDIQPTDNRYINIDDINSHIFVLMVEDARSRAVARFEFYNNKNEMLYVPKWQNS